MNTKLLMEQLMESITKRNGEIYTLPITRKGESLRPKLDIRDPRSPIKISKKTLNRYDTALNALQQIKPDTIQRGRADKKYRKVIKNIGSKITRGIYRGKIKRASDTLTYHFKPSGVISSGGRTNPELHYYPQLAATNYTEAGEHVYSFTTPHGSEGKISMSHRLTAPKSSERRNGHMTKTEIQFVVDSSRAKTGRQGNKSVGIFRNVLAAIKHHSKSHDPDVVTFSASDNNLFGPRNTRVKLYKYLTTKMNKVVGNKYRVSHQEDRQTGQAPGDGPLNFTLERKTLSPRTGRMLIAQLDANREELRKIAKGKITKPINTKEKKEKTK